MSAEDRLRQVLRDEASSVDGHDGDAWGSVQRATARRRATRRRAVGGVVAAVLVVAGVAGFVLLDEDDPATTVAVGPDGSTSTSTSSTATPSTSSTTVLDGAPPLGPIWPFASFEELQAYRDDPGIGMFFDAEATALEFARAYLGMPSPKAGGEGVGQDGSSLFLDVVPRPGAPMVTRVWMYAYDGVHTVFAAETANIVPARGSLASPVGTEIPLEGSSTAYEAHVDVVVRDVAGRELGRTFVMGGANGELGPFSGTITISAPSTEVGAVVFSTSSAEDGTVQEATVVAVRFSPEVVAGARSFSVFFHRGEELVEVRRTGPPTAGVLRQALDALVAGPLPSDGEGLTSLFSSSTADVIAGVRVDADGRAVVDLARTVDNASTSAGSVAFLDSLDATVFQFATVRSIEYRLAGSCEDFWTWLQMDGCQIVER